MGKVDRATALRAMQTALDHGITHFDIARSYGFGRAESVLGAVVKHHRQQVTITTKFGVVPPVLGLKHRVLMPAARAAIRWVPALASRARRQSGEMLAEVRFDVPYAHECLHTSLRELATDHIDIYLVHDPRNLSAEQLAALRDFMTRAKQSGKILRWGLACHVPQDLIWAKDAGADVIQIEGNLSTAHSLGLPHGPHQTLVTRPFCGGLSANRAALIESALPGRLAELAQAGHDLVDLALAISRQLAGPHGSVIAAMYSPEHIVSNARRITAVTSSAVLMAAARDYIAKVAA